MGYQIIWKQFDWNDNMAQDAQDAFEEIRDNLSYGGCTVIGTALAKLALLEKQGAKVDAQALED